jgi:hypothetical protein
MYLPLLDCPMANFGLIEDATCSEDSYNLSLLPYREQPVVYPTVLVTDISWDELYVSFYLASFPLFLCPHQTTADYTGAATLHTCDSADGWNCTLVRKEGLKVYCKCLLHKRQSR